MPSGCPGLLNRPLCLLAILVAARGVDAQPAISNAGERSAAVCRHQSVGDRDRAVANENRLSQGVFRDDTLTLRLVMRGALWYPEGPAGCALSVHVFAEEGGPARVPGPLIRVHAGAHLDYAFSATTIAGGKVTDKVVTIPIRVREP